DIDVLKKQSELIRAQMDRLGIELAEAKEQLTEAQQELDATIDARNKLLESNSKLEKLLTMSSEDSKAFKAQVEEQAAYAAELEKYLRKKRAHEQCLENAGKPGSPPSCLSPIPPGL